MLEDSLHFNFFELMLLIISKKFFLLSLHTHLEVIQEAFYFTFSTSLTPDMPQASLYLFNHKCRRAHTAHTVWWMEYDLTRVHRDKLRIHTTWGAHIYETLLQRSFFFFYLVHFTFHSYLYSSFFSACQYNYSSFTRAEAGIHVLVLSLRIQE